MKGAEAIRQNRERKKLNKMNLPMRLRRSSSARERAETSRTSARKANGRENFGKEAEGTSIKCCVEIKKRWDSEATVELAVSM